MKRSLDTTLLAALLLSGCSTFAARAVEEPPYTVLVEDGPIEVRQYDDLLVASTTVEGRYDEVSGQAFRRLAGFIFGDNRPADSTAMTAPALQEPTRERPSEDDKSQRIAMTAPVIQEPAGDAWTMSFVMPSEYTLETLPQPLDPRVEISTIAAKRVATIRFSGRMNQRKLERYSQELSEWIKANGLAAVSEPRSAGYSPPWTLPPLRRNEIHIDIR